MAFLTAILDLSDACTRLFSTNSAGVSSAAASMSSLPRRKRPEDRNERHKNHGILQSCGCARFPSHLAAKIERRNKRQKNGGVKFNMLRHVSFSPCRLTRIWRGVEGGTDTQRSSFSPNNCLMHRRTGSAAVA